MTVPGCCRVELTLIHPGAHRGSYRSGRPGKRMISEGCWKRGDEMNVLYSGVR